MIEGESYTVHIGNNLDILPTLEDNSVDSIVTDPPYELGFMGKKWDSTGIAYNSDLWRECLRVLKPGGHLLSFGGSRTWHRIAVAIEDAGFEVRDSIAWLYGSGFPKSLDISKAIDKSDAAEARRKRDLEFTAWIRSTGLTSSQIDKITESNMGGHYTTAASQPAVATAELFDKLRPYLPEVPDHIEKMVAERTIESQNFKNREVIGQKTFVRNTQSWEASGGMLAAGEKEINETLPATPEAQQWEGWGTALKPAFEPVIVARKPLIGTVAENVLTYGTGGLNIDGSRIGTREKDESGWAKTGSKASDNVALGKQYDREPISEVGLGRWPANVILDEHTAELLDEQSGISKPKPKRQGQRGGKQHFDGGWDKASIGTWPEDFGGGASRFFYVAKASKRDRNEGLEELEDTQALFASDSNLHLNGDGTPRNKESTTKNFHPTVKPTDLMRYLIKLVTPPNGIVLDPFTGSGSTGKAAILEGFRFIGIEMTEDYIPIIEGRLKHAEQSKGLF